MSKYFCSKLKFFDIFFHDVTVSIQSQKSKSPPINKWWDMIKDKIDKDKIVLINDFVNKDNARNYTWVLTICKAQAQFQTVKSVLGFLLNLEQIT